MRISVFALALALSAPACSRSTATREQQAKKPMEVIFPALVLAAGHDQIDGIARADRVIVCYGRNHPVLHFAFP
jgi:hypothetical protein